MGRHALIISNPGEPRAENYCEGVNVDVRNYLSFLKSPLGGTWYDSEITHMNRPSYAEVRNAIVGLSPDDYTFVVFCGHAYYSERRESTILELRKNEEVDSLDLRTAAKKRTILLDCCRKVEKDIITDTTMAVKAAELRKALHPSQCREYFDQQIETCASGIVVGHACSKDETAGDSQTQGGYYTYSLLRSAEIWGESSNIGMGKRDTLSIVATHNTSVGGVLRLSGGTQHPEIEKPRSEPYFPFAIIA